MSKRAEDAARRIHNRALLKAENYSISHEGSIIEEVAFGRGFKAGFIEGYEQAEKDLTLTWEDMQLIWQLCDTLNSEQQNLCGSKDFFTEVLNRYNKSKEK